MEFSVFVLGFIGLGIASFFDVKFGKIPNWLNLAILFAGIITLLLTLPLDVFGLVLFFGFCVGCAFALFAANILGAGDSKLLISLSPLVFSIASNPYFAFVEIMLAASTLLLICLLIVNFKVIFTKKMKSQIILAMMSSLIPSFIAFSLTNVLPLQNSLLLAVIFSLIFLIFEINWIAAIILAVLSIIAKQGQIITASSAFFLVFLSLTIFKIILIITRKTKEVREEKINFVQFTPFFKKMSSAIKNKTPANQLLKTSLQFKANNSQNLTMPFAPVLAIAWILAYFLIA